MEASVDREAKKAQDLGFGLALALCQREMANTSVYASVMAAYGMTMKMAKASGLEEFDLSQLRAIAKEVRVRSGATRSKG